MSDDDREVKTFSLARKTQPVNIEMDGETVEWKIRELTGAERDEYLMTMRKRFNKDADGQPTSMREFKDAQTTLLHLTMVNENGDTFTMDDIRNWPASLQNYLFGVSQELSKLDNADEDEGDESGND